MKIFFRLLIALVILLWPSEALAISTPDLALQISSIDIYRHLRETNDQLFVGRYFIDYTTNPAENINTAYLVRLVSGDTEVASIRPYSYFDRGYNQGIFGIYFSAATAPTWASSFTLRLEGNPVLVWTPSIPLTTLAVTSGAFSAATTQSANRILLSARIAIIAEEIEQAWNVNLIDDSTGSGKRLSSTGVDYFSNAIPNLGVMAPDVFPTGIESPQYSQPTFNKTYATKIGSRWNGTSIGSVSDDIAEFLGMSGAGPYIRLIGFLAFMLGCAFFVGVRFQNPKPALFLLAPMFVGGMVLDFVPWIFGAIVVMACVLGIGLVLFYKYAQ